VADFNRYIYIGSVYLVGVFGHLPFYEKHEKFPTSLSTQKKGKMMNTAHVMLPTYMAFENPPFRRIQFVHSI